MTNTKYDLAIQVHSKPEVLERILRVVRHRGFQIQALNMPEMNDCNAIKIAVTVSGKRPIEMLYKQLEKLFDVQAISYNKHDG